MEDLNFRHVAVFTLTSQEYTERLLETFPVSSCIRARQLPYATTAILRQSACGNKTSIRLPSSQPNNAVSEHLRRLPVLINCSSMVLSLGSSSHHIFRNKQFKRLFTTTKTPLSRFFNIILLYNKDDTIRMTAILPAKVPEPAPPAPSTPQLCWKRIAKIFS